jgi:hypothetical protein
MFLLYPEGTNGHSEHNGDPSVALLTLENGKEGVNYAGMMSLIGKAVGSAGDIASTIGVITDRAMSALPGLTVTQNTKDWMAEQPYANVTEDLYGNPWHPLLVREGPDGVRDVSLVNLAFHFVGLAAAGVFGSKIVKPAAGASGYAFALKKKLKESAFRKDLLDGVDAAVDMHFETLAVIQGIAAREQKRDVDVISGFLGNDRSLLQRALNRNS